VAVEVEAAEFLFGAEELARGDVAVAVAVHEAEPERAGSGGGGGAKEWAVYERIASADEDAELGRQIRSGYALIGTLMVVFQPLQGGAQLADAELAVVVAIEQAEQAVTVVCERHADKGIGGLALQVQVSQQLLLTELAVVVAIRDREDGLEESGLRVID